MTCGPSGPPSPCLWSRGRPSWQQLWERALQEHIFHHHELPRGVRLQLPSWWQPGDAITRPLTHEEIASPMPALHFPPHSSKTSPSAARQNAAKSRSTPSCATGSSTCWTSGGQNDRGGMQRCLCEVQRLCPGMFDGIHPNTPYRWKRSAPAEAQLGRKTLLSPADMTRLSEHILRVPDVLCLGARMARRGG